MSVSDPFLKQLKGLVLELRTKHDVVTDRSACLTRLCNVLEDIFRKGLKNPGWFGKCDYWSWISKLPNISKQRCNPILCMVIESVKESKKVLTCSGRGRLFIRSALEKKVLAVPIQILAKDFSLSQEWYCKNSILGDEILTEIFQSLLFELTEVKFNLLIKNSSFLDISWTLPIYRKCELVPCEDIGLHVQLVQSYIVVVAVEPSSVAEEYGKIGVGDVIDEIYQQPVRGMKLSAVHSLLKKYHGLPIHMHFIKLHDEEGNMFLPISDLLKDINTQILLQKPVLDNKNEDSSKKPAHAILEEEEYREIPVQGSEGGAEYEAEYLGYEEIGKDGRVCRIEDGVSAVVNKCTIHQHVRLILKEKEIVVTDMTTQQICMQHTYTSISACGRRTDALRYIGYLAGETTCSLAKEFRCYVYQMKNDEEARIALCTIAQGFERTHLLL